MDKKLSKRNALQISLFHSFNNLPQTLYFVVSATNSESDTQESEFEKTFLREGQRIWARGKKINTLFH